MYISKLQSLSKLGILNSADLSTLQRLVHLAIELENGEIVEAVDGETFHFQIMLRKGVMKIKSSGYVVQDA